MPVSFAEPPAGVEQLTHDRLRTIAANGDFRVASLAAATPDRIRLASAHPVFNVGLTDLVRGRPLADLPLTSWRFLVDGGTSTTTAAETIAATATDDAQLASVNDGPFVAGTAEAFTAIAKDPLFARGDWELRLVRVPALYVLAVWAHDRLTGDDRLRPIAPVPGFLDASKTCGWEAFAAALAPHAAAKLQADAPRRS